MRAGWRISLGAAAVVAAGIAVTLALRPSPVAVEVAPVVEGALAVTIDEQGETRAHDRFVIAAPVPGRLERVDVHEGDPVRAGDVVAALHAAPLSAQEREAQLARIDAARALVLEAEDNVRKARTAAAQARRERERAEKLVAERFVSPQALERAKDQEAMALADQDAAVARTRAANAQLAAVRAGLTAAEPGARDRPIELHSPSDGRVLRVVEKSERVLAAGAPIAIVGDPRKLEVVVDLLSTEAVKVRPGMSATLEGWGGPTPISARVRVVEPAAFTKVSALGVEEQRVNVVLDIPEAPPSLGDAFRVDVRILETEARVRKLPASAVFRTATGDRVFVVRDGRAQARDVEIGLRNRDEAQVKSGLEAGESVVRFPSSALADGTSVREVPVVGRRS
jgi:HlyD family secretion protein